MDYTELVDAVVEITERGENIPRVQLAIAKATLKLHAADFWQRDCVEIMLDSTKFTDNAPRYEISVSENLPGFRKFRYIEAYDNSVSPGRVIMSIMEGNPTSTKNEYGYVKNAQYYLAGDTVVILFGCTPPAWLIGYYTWPKVSATDYNSWIGRDHPFAVLDEAVAEIFGAVGDADEAQRRRAMFPGNLQLIRINEIEAEAR